MDRMSEPITGPMPGAHADSRGTQDAKDKNSGKERYRRPLGTQSVFTVEERANFEVDKEDNMDGLVMANAVDSHDADLATALLNSMLDQTQEASGGATLRSMDKKSIDGTPSGDNSNRKTSKKNEESNGRDWERFKQNKSVRLCCYLLCLVVLAIGAVAVWLATRNDGASNEPSSQAVGIPNKEIETNVPVNTVTPTQDYDAIENPFISASPSGPPTSANIEVAFDPPSAEDCAAIASGNTIQDQDTMPVQSYQLDLDATSFLPVDLSISAGIIEDKLRELMAPALTGCNRIVRNLRYHRYLDSGAFAYVIGNVAVDASGVEGVQCLDDSSQRFINTFFGDGVLAEKLDLSRLYQSIIVVNLGSMDPTESPSTSNASPSAEPTITVRPTPASEARRPSPNPTAKPTAELTILTTFSPVAGETPRPTPNPTPGLTANPTSSPTPNPAPEQTANPTPKPTSGPTFFPTPGPTPGLTFPPTPPLTPPQPTVALADPTPPPTPSPTPFPALQSTPGSTPKTPTPGPTQNPTPGPTRNPTPGPTPNPTPRPTPGPTFFPTPGPTAPPTPGPTLPPTSPPTLRPTTAQPTPMPTPAPPTETCFQSNSELVGAVDEWFQSSKTKASVERQYGTIGDWCFGPGVTSMQELFRDRTNFNEDIGNWDVSSVDVMFATFEQASSFNQDLSSWDVSSVTNMGSMFRGAATFNQDFSLWDVSSVKDMYSMFYLASSFDQELSSWVVSTVTRMGFMFSDARAFNRDVSSWDVSSVKTMSAMFSCASSFNQDISSWDVLSVTDMSWMFSQATSFNQGLSSWDVSRVTAMEYMFRRASAFNGDLSSWDVSSVTSMSYMFSRATSFNRDLSSWDVSSLTDMGAMFQFTTTF
ncbi:unnamed protein product [Cylindrotheca closterium]|uniref:BspA family leucine-rich repeat surface protein n=1 Tax=Cylindrotheca closterium TaxID=2856 RepID=A0AAD2FEN6_9STRA|nr:unnamed protein product [Cylindrotheca closterium]